MRITGRTLVISAALTLIVPAASQVVLALLPDALTGARTLFLVYEVSFAVLTLVLLRSHPNARLPWVRSVARFVLAYYTLWAGADVLILLIDDPGFLLRVVPNVLYYGGLIAAIAAFAPRKP